MSSYPFQEHPRPKPFLKWAGGKTKLVSQLTRLIPRAKSYYEPFIGGGALFFHLVFEERVERAFINDVNPELVNCYQVIKDRPEELIEVIRGMPIDKGFYYDLRSRELDDPISMAARTIYLNKTGFNGLYRQNKKGGYNVPWGKHKNPKLIDEANIRSCSDALRLATITNQDFALAVQDAEEGDAVYFDPPYVPVSKTSNFKNYTKDGFTFEDQERLAAVFKNLARRGVTVVLSNSDVPAVHQLYPAFQKIVVPMTRNINSKANKRGPVNELLVVGGL